MNIPQQIIAASQCKKISDIGASGATEAVSTVISMLGLRDDKIPQGKEKTDLLAYVYRNLGQYSREEFTLAWTLFVKGILDYQKDLYDKISPLFIENVMQSYARYRLAYMPRANQDEPEKKVSKNEAQRIIRDTVIFQFNQYQKTKSFLDFGSPIYKYLVKNELLNITFTKTKEIIIRARVQNEIEFKEKTNKKMTISDLRSLFRKGSQNEILKEKIRYNCVRLFFDNIISMGGTIEDYI